MSKTEVPRGENLFKEKIAAHKPEFSSYIAVQFRSSENVAEISDALMQLVKKTNLSVVFFRAGAAPGTVGDIFSQYLGSGLS